MKLRPVGRTSSLICCSPGSIRTRYVTIVFLNSGYNNVVALKAQIQYLIIPKKFSARTIYDDFSTNIVN